MDPERELAILRRRLLGFSLLCAPTQGPLDHGRDLVLAPSGDGPTRDFALVEGMDNLGQALTVALTTPLTGDVFNVDFGFDGLNAHCRSRRCPIMVQERIRIAVITLLQKDPRVRRIVDVKLQDGRLNNPGANIRELDVKVVFETVTGDTTTLDLGKVVPNGLTSRSPPRTSLRSMRNWPAPRAPRATASLMDGFVPKPFARLLAEKLALARTVFGSDVDLTSGSAIRKILEVTALEDARTWAALGAIYDNQFVSSARGEALSRLGEELGLAAAVPAGARHDPSHAHAAGRAQRAFDPARRAPLYQRQPPRGHHRKRGPHPRPADPRMSPWRRSIPAPSTTSTPTSAREAAIRRRSLSGTATTSSSSPCGTRPGPTCWKAWWGSRTRGSLAGGELRWPDTRYRDLLLRAPRSTWSVEAIRIAASLVPGVRRVVVRDGGGLDIDLPIFGTFNFIERVFGAERDIVSPNFFTVLVALTDAAIFEGPAGVRVSVESVIEDLRPIGIYPRVQEAHRVFVGIAADLVVTGIPLPRTSTGVINDSDAAKTFKKALLDRVQRYVDTLDFGEPVRFSEVTYALMGEPGLADVRNLRLLRSPPRLDEVKQLGGRVFSELPRGENLTVGVSAIATFADDFALMKIV